LLDVNLAVQIQEPILMKTEARASKHQRNGLLSVEPRVRVKRCLLETIDRACAGQKALNAFSKKREKFDST